MLLVGSIAVVHGEEDEQAFRRALPGYVYRFPVDHAAHPEFRTEWWYYTGHLTTAKGRNFGFQLTFFPALSLCMFSCNLTSQSWTQTWYVSESAPAIFNAPLLTFS